MQPLDVTHLCAPEPDTIFSWRDECFPRKLDELRQSAYASLLTLPTDAKDMACRGEHLAAYATELVRVFWCGDIRRSYARARPLCFRWHFPGEPGAGLASMSCTLPGFEVMCVLISAAILFYRGSNASVCTETATCLAKRCAEMATWAANLGCPVGSTGKLISDAQWNRLRRQTLPFQMLPGWLKAFAQLALHTRTLAVARRATTRVASHNRAAQDTAAELACVRREALCSEIMVTAAQRRMLQRQFDEAYEESTQLACAGATTDAEQALEDASTHPYVHGLVQVARWYANTLEHTHVTDALVERWRRVEHINAASSADPVTDMDEIMQWIQSLPRVPELWGELGEKSN